MSACKVSADRHTACGWVSTKTFKTARVHGEVASACMPNTCKLPSRTSTCPAVPLRSEGAPVASSARSGPQPKPVTDNHHRFEQGGQTSSCLRCKCLSPGTSDMRWCASSSTFRSPTFHRKQLALPAHGVHVRLGPRVELCKHAELLFMELRPLCRLTKHLQEPLVLGLFPVAMCRASSCVQCSAV